MSAAVYIEVTAGLAACKRKTANVSSEVFSSSSGETFTVGEQ